MRKVILVLLIMFSFVSCTDDVTFNDPSFQGIKDGENWRANDARVILNANGTMTIEAYSQFEVVKFVVSSPSKGIRKFGVNTSNVASYVATYDGITESYTTGVDVGSGELKITQSPTDTGKLSGTFKFRAVNENGTESGFTNRVIYNVPVK